MKFLIVVVAGVLLFGLDVDIERIGLIRAVGVLSVSEAMPLCAHFIDD